MLRKIIQWGLGLFVLFYLVTNPTGAAGFVHTVFNGLHSISTSLSTFVSSL